MKNLCYIQARGGSQRVKNKNLYKWYGTPFLVDAIKKAQKSGLFDLIIVSSDSVRILSAARRAGALPVLRSKETSNAYATDDDVYAELEPAFKKFDNVCKLYPCVPLLKVAELKAAYKVFRKLESGGLMGVDTKGNDAGAFYFFKPKDVITRLSYINWSKYELPISQDINTYEDIEEAKRKYENSGILAK